MSSTTWRTNVLTKNGLKRVFTYFLEKPYPAEFKQYLDKEIRAIHPGVLGVWVSQMPQDDFTSVNVEYSSDKIREEVVFLVNIGEATQRAKNKFEANGLGETIT